ncbi:PilZ domain-containing protein [Cellvibrio sp.]|uniref:PilZ domain-containing protein n=1 Tax=Cellvibrio sp. TaxID=1965322 RepID=UPI0039647DA7
MSDLSPQNCDRSLHRHLISGDVDVYDSLRDIYLGRLVNIHTQGLMLVGDVPLEEDRLYELDMHIPDEQNNKKVLRVGVDCLWTRAADQNGKHWTGFSIIDLTPHAMEEIHKLIQRWGHA